MWSVRPLRWRRCCAMPASRTYRSCAPAASRPLSDAAPHPRARRPSCCTLDHAVHSGMFGGAVPDGLTTLCRLLATMHDDAGDVAVEGLVGRGGSTLDYPEDRFREEAGLLDGVSLMGTGSIVDRVWTRP